MQCRSNVCQNIFWVNEKHNRQAKIYIISYGHMIKIATTPIYTRGDQKVRGKVLLNRIAFIDCDENS